MTVIERQTILVDASKIKVEVKNLKVKLKVENELMLKVGQVIINHHHICVKTEKIKTVTIDSI